MSTIHTQTLEKLRTFDTPTICNLIELFEVRPRNTGYMDARIQACFPEMVPMVGFAATAAFRSSGPPRGGDAYAGTGDQAERFGELGERLFDVAVYSDAMPAELVPLVEEFADVPDRLGH